MQQQTHTKGYKFKNSIYLTTFTDWFLGFFGRGAQFILIVTTIYQGATLLPGISLPQPINNAVFIIQMLTLDIGGMGLARIAKQTRDEGNNEGAKAAEILSNRLIAIVIVTLVASAMEMVIRPLPFYGHISTGASVFFGIVSASLTIARAIYAVRYNVVMHSLTSHEQTPAIPHTDVQEIVKKAIEDATSNQAKTLDELKIQLEEVKKVASVPQILPPPVDPALLVQAATEEILRQVEARFQAIDQTILRQNVTVSEANQLPENNQIQAKSLPENAASKQSSGREFRQRVQAANSVSSPNSEGIKRAAKVSSQEGQPIIHLVPASATRDELKAEAIRLHEEERLSSYEVGEKLGKSAKTVQTWLKKAKDETDNEVIEATN